MPIDCTDPNALQAAAACYCFPKATQEAIMIYLLQQIAGDTSTPSELAEKAACLCIPDAKQREAVITYLLCSIVNA